jgi:hypothetical protein
LTPSILSRLGRGLLLACAAPCVVLDIIETAIADRAHEVELQRRCNELTERLRVAKCDAERDRRCIVSLVELVDRNGQEIYRLERTLSTVYETGWRAIVDRDAARAYGEDMRQALSEAKGRERGGSEQRCAKCTGAICYTDIAVPAWMHLECPDGPPREPMPLVDSATGPIDMYTWAADVRARVAAALGPEPAGPIEPREATPEPASPAVLCAWCLGDIDDSTYCMDNTHPVCGEHAFSEVPNYLEVKARVAARAASCPSRRTSADPLAVVCIHCPAAQGEPCRPRAARAPREESER